MNAPFTIGLTGGIASGKSSTARYFADYGIAVISADVIARDILAKNSNTLAEVVHAFGSGILDNDQELDRAKLRQVIFTDARARQQLDAITHPAIGKALLQAARAARSAYVILEIPLLIEAKLTATVKRVLVINMAHELQISRVMQRDGCTKADAESAIAAQTSAATRLQYADDIIHNSGSLHKLKQQVALLHPLYTTLAAKKPAVQHKPTLAPSKDSGLSGLDLH